ARRARRSLGVARRAAPRRGLAAPAGRPRCLSQAGSGAPAVGRRCSGAVPALLAVLEPAASPGVLRRPKRLAAAAVVPALLGLAGATAVRALPRQATSAPPGLCSSGRP